MSDPTSRRRAGNRRVLRPLLWWVLLVLALFLIRTHQRLSAHTILKFEPAMAGRSVQLEAAATLDGQALPSGARVNIGWHTLVIRHPKAKLFTTNLFIWYGERDLKTIPLTRATGTLKLSARPPARELSLRGPELSAVETNSSGFTVTVPSDVYAVEARFKHVTETSTMVVGEDGTASKEFAPQLGSVNVTCNQTDASFELANSNGRILERGSVPALLAEIPSGTYELTVRHRGHERNRSVTVTANATNTVLIEFQYGALLLQTEPPGAAVLRGKASLGQTPLFLAEFPAGSERILFEHREYEPLEVILETAPNRTNHFQTNLVSRRYTGALEQARRYFASERYGEAAAAAGEALKHNAADSAAEALQREATALQRIARARSFAERREFGQAIVELNAALELMPDHAGAKALLAEYTKREDERVATETQRAAEAAEQARKREAAALAEQRTRAQITDLNEGFEMLVRGFEDASRFAKHELTSTDAVAVVGPAVRQALATGQPAFQIVRFEQPRPDRFTLQARQSMGLSYRDCLMAGIQVRENETRVVFKVVEYDHPPKSNLLGGLLGAVVTPQTDNDGTRAARFQQQIKEGAEMVKARLEKAINASTR